ncbi:MAG: dTDP-4-dehydrorhamnose 3,5-epimerase family protein [Halobacteriovoraceae bacterium]|nr:dTDP-4-dehydrorhamnose 3,5-epimerase family protein [Halobacteriovoraceae bacterium]
MNIEKTKIEGCFILTPTIFEDSRGKFVKNFNCKVFKDYNLDTDFKESYYSISKKFVARGMHFQIPPHDHCKLVYVSTGKIKDFILDLRKNSKTFGEVIEIELSSKNCRQVYLSKGLAHGFISIEDSTTVHYMQTTIYSQESDKGIHLSHVVKDIHNYTLSQRDLTHPTFTEFNSPF